MGWGDLSDFPASAMRPRRHFYDADHYLIQCRRVNYLKTSVSF